jgi:hypothetical protein
MEVEMDGDGMKAEECWVDRRADRRAPAAAYSLMVVTVLMVFD